MTTPEQDVPVEAQEQIRKAVNTALAKPAAAQGFLSSIPDINVGEAKGKITEVLGTVLGAIDEIQKYQWLLPAKYHEPLQKLEDALKKVQGWLD
jgi:ATP:corrinoid adenosyltransferase